MTKKDNNSKKNNNSKKDNNLKKDNKDDKKFNDNLNEGNNNEDNNNEDNNNEDNNNEDNKFIPSIIFIFEKKNNHKNCNDIFCNDDLNKNLSKEDDDINENDYYGPINEDDCNLENEDDKEDDPDYNPEDDADYNPEKDNKVNSYYNENQNNRKVNKPLNNKRKNNNDELDNNGLDIFFQKFVSGINNRHSHKKRLKVIDHFTEYFKESDILLPINKSIKTLKDLIELGKTYDPKDKNRYVINLKALNKCVEPLENLESMIGMKSIKEMIIDLIFFRLQNLQDTKEELWHLVIQGTPGSGKTEVAKIIGKLYYSLGITKKDKFTLAKRSDLIGKYLGHTAKLTQEVFDNAKGGILFIDEAYSLGNPEGKDSFSKECIDTINQNLTENKETIVFIAGYKDQLNESFFSYNPGLNRRFKIRFTVDKYNALELRDIYLKKIRENGWLIMDNNIEKEIPIKFFEKNLNIFKYNGGDMENLWHLTKIVHARRIFGKVNDIVKKIIYEDLESALKLYSENDEVKNRNDEISKYVMNSMYV